MKTLSLFSPSMRCSKWTRQRAHTLLEVLVASGVAILLFVALASTVTNASRFFEFATRRDEMLERSRRALDEITEDLALSNALSLETGADGTPTLTFTLPVDVGEDANDNHVLDSGEDADADGILDRTDGDVISDAGEAEWGCEEADGPRLDLPGSPHRIQLAFVRKAILEESDVGADLNGDGDAVDSFSLGSIVRTTSGGLTRSLGGGAFLVARADSNGDRDGDGAADPLLRLGGETFEDANRNGVRDAGETFADANSNGRWDAFWRLHLTAILRDGRDTPRLLHIVREVTLRNPTR